MVKQKTSEVNLKCKLEKLVFGMGKEISKKDCSREVQLDILGVLKLMIVLSFFVVLSIVGLLYDRKHIEHEISKETIIRTPQVIQIDKSTLELVKTDIRGGRLYSYYRKNQGEVWEFYTTSVKIEKDCLCK